MVDQYREWSSKQKNISDRTKTITINDIDHDTDHEITISEHIDFTDNRMLNGFFAKVLNNEYLVMDINNMDDGDIERITNHRNYDESWAESEDSNIDIHSFHVILEGVFANYLLEYLIGENDYIVDYNFLFGSGTGLDINPKEIYDLYAKIVQRIRNN